LRASDGATATVRTHLYNHLRGTFGWPEQFSPRTIINQSFIDQQEGVSFDELKKLHDEALQKGDVAWGPQGRTATYAGANIGLVKTVDEAAAIVTAARREALAIIRSLDEFLSPVES
jgi:nitronate monooxygenase